MKIGDDFKNNWLYLCILYLSTILTPLSTLHTPRKLNKVKLYNNENR